MTRGSLFTLLVLFMAAAASAGCGVEELTLQPTREPPSRVSATAAADIFILDEESADLTIPSSLTSVQPIPAHVVLAPGETIALSAVAFDQHGREVRRINVSWQALDNRAGSITLSGVFRAGFTEGTYDRALVVTAQPPIGLGAGLVRTEVPVTIISLESGLRPAGIRVFPQRAELEPRESMHLVPLAIDANGVTVPDMKFKWEVLEPLAGTISSDGRFEAAGIVGTFPSAVRVTLLEPKGVPLGDISTSIDVFILDPGEAIRGLTATVLPQIISLRTEEDVRFDTMVLDRRGNLVEVSGISWVVVDPSAGTVSGSGRFTAGTEPGIFQDSIRVSMFVPSSGETLVSTATVVVVEVSAIDTGPIGVDPDETPEVRVFPEIAIYPERIVLSPGEEARVTLIGLGGDVAGLQSADIYWYLNPPTVADMSRSAVVTAHNSPGVHPGAIRAVVTLETEYGSVTEEVAATLIIRGSLERVRSRPKWRPWPGATESSSGP